jgi:hypothetical protein
MLPGMVCAWISGTLNHFHVTARASVLPIMIDNKPLLCRVDISSDPHTFHGDRFGVLKSCARAACRAAAALRAMRHALSPISRGSDSARAPGAAICIFSVQDLSIRRINVSVISSCHCSRLVRPTACISLGVSVELMEIRDNRLRSLFQYWSSKLRGRSMPARRDLDPLEMRPWLGNLVLVDFPAEDLTQYKIRLEGVNVVQFYGSSRTGRGIEVMTSEIERQVVLPQFFSVVETKEPAYYEAEFISSEGVLTYQHKLVLPLSDDDVRVNMTLAGIYFDRVPAEAG